MNKKIYLAIVSIGLGSVAISKPQHKTFSEEPSKRDLKVQKARAQAQDQKTEAEVWAKARGLRVRQNDGHKIVELMAIRDGKPLYYGTHNVQAAISTAANQVRNTSPYNVSGSGITIGVWDGGAVKSDHSEFSGGRVSVIDNSSVNAHATHVGGTLAADGDYAPLLGMAPSAHIDSYDWNEDVAEMTGRAAASPGQSSDIYLSNHSYGYISGWDRVAATEYIWYGDSWGATGREELFGRYVNEARQWDDIVYDAPYFLPFKSAGNDRSDNPSSGNTVRNGTSGSPVSYNPAIHPAGDGVYKSGYDTVGAVGTAKNIMTVGAVDDATSGSSRWLGGAAMSTFSGWGPADDGRIKPDIVANGVSLSSLSTMEGYYSVQSGTSMASPNACGSAALLVDYYDNLYSNEAMRASTLKGLIIHTADDLGRPGPDYSYGWGLMNTLEAALLLKKYSEGDTIRMREDEIDEGETDSCSFTWNAVEPIRVTLCWTDPPGASTSIHDNRTPRLVNDLDLKIVGPSGTYYPYKLDYNNPENNATANSENNVDNVEQVYIESPTPGTYTIEVHYDNSTATPAQPQWYSLLVTGNVAGQPDADGDGIPDDWEIQYFGGATNALATADPDGDGADNLTEYIAGTDPNNANSVFEVTNHSAPNGSITDFELDWGPTTNGRIYSVSWTDHLIIKPFSVIASNLPPSQTSFIDTAPRTGKQNYYRVEVTKP